jgi:hypothetical protein
VVVGDVVRIDDYRARRRLPGRSPDEGAMTPSPSVTNCARGVSSVAPAFRVPILRGPIARSASSGRAAPRLGRAGRPPVRGGRRSCRVPAEGRTGAAVHPGDRAAESGPVRPTGDILEDQGVRGDAEDVRHRHARPPAPPGRGHAPRRQRRPAGFTAFPVSQWKKIWSSNPLERLNKEIKRRTDVGVFPNPEALLRLAGAYWSRPTTNGRSPTAATSPKTRWLCSTGRPGRGGGAAGADRVIVTTPLTNTVRPTSTAQRDVTAALLVAGVVAVKVAARRLPREPGT